MDHQEALASSITKYKEKGNKKIAWFSKDVKDKFKKKLKANWKNNNIS